MPSQDAGFLSKLIVYKKGVILLNAALGDSLIVTIKKVTEHNRKSSLRKLWKYVKVDRS